MVFISRLKEANADLGNGAHEIILVILRMVVKVLSGGEPFLRKVWFKFFFYDLCGLYIVPR